MQQDTCPHILLVGIEIKKKKLGNHFAKYIKIIFKFLTFDPNIVPLKMLSNKISKETCINVCPRTFVTVLTIITKTRNDLNA